MPRALVSLGSNLGDTAAAMDLAERALRGMAKAGSLRVSRRSTTAPVGGPAGQRAFSNAAAVFETALAPQKLLDGLRRIEASLERERHERWAPRTLDLDLLLYGDQTLHSEALRIPHPRMTYRPFVLEPAAEVAGDWRHPEAGATLDELLRVLRGGRDAVALVGDDPRVAAWVRSAASPGVAIEGGEAVRADPPKLTLDARRQPRADPCAGPRLALADCPPEHWRSEIMAALECVWPSGTANPDSPLPLREGWGGRVEAFRIAGRGLGRSANPPLAPRGMRLTDALPDTP